MKYSDLRYVDECAERLAIFVRGTALLHWKLDLDPGGSSDGFPTGTPRVRRRGAIRDFRIAGPSQRALAVAVTGSHVMQANGPHPVTRRDFRNLEVLRPSPGAAAPPARLSRLTTTVSLEMLQRTVSRLPIVLFTALLASCGGDDTAAGGEALQIAVIPKGTSHDFWRSVHAAATGAPTLSIEATRKRRPAAVPATPENAKYGQACQSK